MSRPWAVVVSHHASWIERNSAPALPMASKMFSRSRVDRASLSSRQHVRLDPGLAARAFNAFASSLRSERAPLTFS